MFPRYLVLAGVLAMAPPTQAQEAVEQPQQVEQPAAAKGPVRQAIPRGSAAKQAAPPESARPAPRPEAQRVGAAPEAQRVEADGAADDQRRAVPRGSRPQGDNPRTGTAVPRATRPAPAPGPPATARADRGRVDNRGRTVIVRPPAVYNNYYTYPRHSYPYGYGAFGLGYFYYDPYRWYPDAYSYSPYAGSGYYPRYYPRSYSYGFDIGELRLQVSPRHAQVFVDGYYAGIVDDYDGAFQSLKLESGAYSIQIVAPGYGTLDFDVRINPGQKITYRGDLPRP